MQQIIDNKDVEKFISETKYFLDEYDSIISHWDLSGNFFLHYLIEIHENIIQLISRFTTLSLDGVGARKHEHFFNLKCCGQEFHSVADLRRHHHSCRHRNSAFQETNNCELKSALVKLAFFNRRVNGYLQYGTVADRYLCLYLKKILKK
ncbi:uncharacterized protein LOC129776704 [Toxorhynchites rutilus septentrionalis]|uniref:uncharacterized protein LOC129776704 n=1 Tax=Toxorhynchites rutilus septentrionalis TaxID=329112 RepID=UPI0024799332|nr:uncharacterized protein LOC129776704 [Toxorhynchites rutilus septentrionalis]